jgi:hypothetical protein
VEVLQASTSSLAAAAVVALSTMVPERVWLAKPGGWHWKWHP